MATLQSRPTTPLLRQRISLLIILIALSLVFCFLPVASPQDDITTLDSAIKKLITKYKLTKSKIGIKAISLTDNTVIYERNADTRLIPASNLKLFTTGAALCLLGPDFNYETALYRDGQITTLRSPVDRANGVLEGNLIVKSNGNPNVSGRFYDGHSTAVFEEWGRTLNALGIKEVAGAIIIDDTAFDREYLVPSWPSDQLCNWYCAPISAVSFNDNCVDITVYPTLQPARMGSPVDRADKKNDHVRYRLEPETDYVTMVNKCQLTARSSLQSIELWRTPETNTITIKGRCYDGGDAYKASVTIDEPGLYFGTVLKETLSRKSGITVSGEVMLADKTFDPQKEHLAKIASVKTDLVTTLAVTNKNSQNFYAEQLVKTLGYYSTGKGTWKSGLAQIRKFLKDNNIISEVDADDFIQRDGSGLSPQDRVTANQMANLLVYLARHKYGEKFLETLAVSGVDGTLKKRLNGKGKAHQVWAKTGYIKNVSALSGYIKNGNHIAFSIIINGVADVSRAKQFQDEVVSLLMEY